MPRALRYQYAGAVYHLMARGDGGKADSETDEDRPAVEAFVRMKQREVDGRKVLAPPLVRMRSAAGNPWIAEHLAMGNPGSVSGSVSTGRATKETPKNTEKIGRMLKCILTRMARD